MNASTPSPGFGSAPTPGCTIRPCHPHDRPRLQEICYRTGYSGETLAGRCLFQDPTLFFLLFGAHYLHFQPRYCFSALVDTRVVGYIVATDDTCRQLTDYIRTIWRRARLRQLQTRHRPTAAFARNVLTSQREDHRTAHRNPFYRDWPAHLHINIDAGFQRRGIGTMLMTALTDALRAAGIRGLHLRTSSHYRKAVPFYHKYGFELLSSAPSSSWPGITDSQLLTFVKPV